MTLALKIFCYALTLVLWQGTMAFAQNRGPSLTYFDVAYTYTDFIYKEPDLMTERGQLSGLRGDVGFNLTRWMSFGLGGEYHGGNLNFDGTTFGAPNSQGLSKDYIRELRGQIQLHYGPLSLSYGAAERYWFNDLISYRQRTKYNYNPVAIIFNGGPFYLRFEKYLWQKGWNKSHMSDLNANARDVEFNLGTGEGMAGEIGYRLPNLGAITTQLFFKYTTWSIKESDVQNDGTQNLTKPKSKSTILQAGIGLVF